MAGLPDEEVLGLYFDWEVWAREEQLVPAPAAVSAWFVWLILAGRRYGKTHTGTPSGYSFRRGVGTEA